MFNWYREEADNCFLMHTPYPTPRYLGNAQKKTFFFREGFPKVKLAVAPISFSGAHTYQHRGTDSCHINITILPQRLKHSSQRDNVSFARKFDRNLHELAKGGEQGCKSVEIIKMRKFKGVENVLAFIHLQGCKLMKRFLAIV